MVITPVNGYILPTQIIDHDMDDIGFRGSLCPSGEKKQEGEQERGSKSDVLFRRNSLGA